MIRGVPEVIQEPIIRSFQASPVDEIKLYESYVKHVESVWFPRYVYLKTWLEDGRKYDAPLDPYRVLWVDPEDIVYWQRSKPKGGYRNKMFAYVEGGDWDNDLPLFENHHIYEFLREHFEEGSPWNETKFFDQFCEKIKDKDTYWNGCSSVEDFYDRCEYLEEIYHDIRENGVKPYEQLEQGSAIAKSYPENIHINIGQDGQLIYLNGRHRLSLAKLLGIESIPVNVMVRHESWQAVRDEIVRADDREALSDHANAQLDHPDVRYLRTN